MKNLNLKLTLSIFAMGCALAGSQQAFAAASATQTYGVEATVDPTCNIPTAPTVTSSSAAYSGGFDGDISFDDAIDTTDATLNAGSAVLTYANVMCNYVASVSVQTTNGGMTQTSGTATDPTVAGTFLNRIDYTADAAYCGAPATSITTAGTTGAKASNTCAGANIGDLVVTVSVADGTTPILEGQYDDTLTVQVGAAL